MITTERLNLRIGTEDESARIVKFYQDNEDHLAPWDPPKPTDFYSERYWQNKMNQAQLEAESDESLRLNVYLNGSDELVGMVNFTNIVRGPFQGCHLGYKIAKKYEGHGLMSEALKAGINYIFTELNIHRIEAAFIPKNTRSEKLLRSLNFDFHGIATNYLLIAGAWQDHQLTSLTNKNWVQS